MYLDKIISIMINILINNDRAFYIFSSFAITLYTYYHSCMFWLMYISIQKFTIIFIMIMDKYLDNYLDNPDYCTALLINAAIFNLRQVLIGLL